MQMLEEADIPDPSARKGLSSFLSVVVVIFVVVCPAEVVTGSSLARSLLSVLTRLAFIGRERERHVICFQLVYSHETSGSQSNVC